MSNKITLKIYVIGGDAVSEQAVSDLRQICEEQFEGKYSLEIIDVLKNPQLAENDKILAVPTVLKILPEPIRRVIGSLANHEKVLLGLDLVNY